VTDLDRPCDSCGGTAVADPGIDVVDGRLVWSVSVRCPACGAAVEVCGRDEPPDDVRAAVLARDGVARLTVDAGANRVAVLRVLRRDGRTLDAAADAYARLTGDGLTGTGAELRLLAGRLEAAGARVTVARDR
jgi:hypothetical protein